MKKAGKLTWIKPYEKEKTCSGEKKTMGCFYYGMFETLPATAMFKNFLNSFSATS